jgi:hypothetical protein
MLRFQPGPFGGAFDEVLYDSPIFVPIISTCGLLVFVWLATAWALWRGRRRPVGQSAGRGFPVTSVGCRGPDD